MATWASLTPDQQARVMAYDNRDLRPALMALGRALAQTSLSLIPQYLSSPSGLPSTLAAPATDSVAGILATLTAGEVVATKTDLALAGPVLASKIVTYTVALNNLLGTNFTPAIQQDLAQFVGSTNLLGP
jgi:hypothetical protein